MIARVWRGSTRAEDADAYVAYVEATGLKGARALPGNRGTLVLRRVHDGRAEFETILLFDSLDDIRAFAAESYARPIWDRWAGPQRRHTAGVALT